MKNVVFDLGRAIGLSKRTMTLTRENRGGDGLTNPVVVEHELAATATYAVYSLDEKTIWTATLVDTDINNVVSEKCVLVFNTQANQNPGPSSRGRLKIDKITDSGDTSLLTESAGTGTGLTTAQSDLLTQIEDLTATASQLNAAAAVVANANTAGGVAVLDAAGNWSRLAANIDAANADATRAGVQVAGDDPALWATLGLWDAHSSMTILNPGYAARQKCNINKIVVNVYSHSGATWKLKVFRWEGSGSYRCIAEASFVPTANVSQTFQVSDSTLATSVGVEEGDILGLYIPSGNNNVNGYASRYSSGRKMVSYAGEILINDHHVCAATANAGEALCLSAYGDVAPYAVWLGDSIVSSGNGSVIFANDVWLGPFEISNTAISLPGGIPGDQNYSFSHRVATRMPVGFTYQNLAKNGLCLCDAGGTNEEHFQDRFLPMAIAAKPKVIFIHAGVNDVGNPGSTLGTRGNRTPAQMTAALVAIDALIGPDIRVYLDEILPSPDFAMSATMEAKFKSVNVAYSAFCASHSNWTLVKCYDVMSVNDAVPSLGGAPCRQLNPIYANNTSFDGTNSDSAHLQLFGVDKQAAIIASYLLGGYVDGKWPTKLPINTGISITLAAEQSGSTVNVNSATSRSIYLPPCQSGLEFTLVIAGVPGGGSGHNFVPEGYDKIIGLSGLSGTPGAAVNSTQATSVVNDHLHLIGGTGNTWRVVESRGTWAN